MNVGNLVRRKPNPVTNQPEILGLVTEMINASNASAIRIAFIDPELNTNRGDRYWRNAKHFEVVS